jgi:alpha-L-fucosidase
MNLTRRRAIALFAAVTLKSGRAFSQAPPSSPSLSLPLTEGPFTGTRESLQKYEIPAWYGEAKFGIWSHWGPQSGAEQGDWYARRMYIQGERQYKSHLETFGHPSKSGYKEIVQNFKAAK